MYSIFLFLKVSFLEKSLYILINNGMIGSKKWYRIHLISYIRINVWNEVYTNGRIQPFYKEKIFYD